jgi:hypothetical protein
LLFAQWISLECGHLLTPAYLRFATLQILNGLMMIELALLAEVAWNLEIRILSYSALIYAHNIVKQVALTSVMLCIVYSTSD